MRAWSLMGATHVKTKGPRRRRHGVPEPPRLR
jgi:hypothetical protein